MIEPAPVYTKVGAFTLPSFLVAMMLDESTCFVDPEDVAIVSAAIAGRATGSYPGLVWVGLKVTRLIGLIAERRLSIFVDAAAAKLSRDEFAAAIEEEAEGGVHAAASEAKGAPGDVDVAGVVPGLGQGGLGLPTMSSAPLMRGIDPGQMET